LEVVVVQTSPGGGAEEIGEGFRVPVGKAQVGDAGVLVVGDADDNGVGDRRSLGGAGAARLCASAGKGVILFSVWEFRLKKGRNAQKRRQNFLMVRLI